MVKLVALYKRPADVEAFEKHYTEIHAPLARKMPGLKKLEISRMTGSPGGSAKYYLMAELYFEDQAALMAGLGSDEGKAAAKDVMGFAGDIVTMMFAMVDG
ncbi:MAG: EthD family reductase [Phycisphaerae bacterium]